LLGQIGVLKLTTNYADNLYRIQRIRGPELQPIKIANVQSRITNNGKVDTLIDRRNNEDVIWRKIK
jgi:hypothetical protein